MRYSRTELLRRVELTRQAFVDEQVADAFKKQQSWDDALAEWKRDQAPRLVELLNALSKKIIDGQPVTHHDTNELRSQWVSSRTLLFTAGDRPRVPDTFTHPPYLDDLANVLASMTDDEVSGHALESAGVLRHVRRLHRLSTPPVKPSRD